MLAMEELLCELTEEDVDERGLPPGFRFHPTDEELITFYLASKVFNGSFCGVEIAELDLNRCEPWELPDAAKMGEREWYFYSLRDRKYPTGLRTNRATGAGYWKATGKDREVYSASTGALLGMKKTLVFYKGRAPRGEKTKWVMHEYRLDGDFSCRHTCKEEWVICRIFHKAGEKKNGLFMQQEQGFLLEASSPPIHNYHSLPALLEEAPSTFLDCQSDTHTEDHLHNPFLHDHDDLKTLINPFLASQSHLIFSSNDLQPAFLTNDTTDDSTLKNTITPGNKNVPYQNWNLKEQSTIIPKQCKIEANFPHFQLHDGSSSSLNWLDNYMVHPNPYQNPLFLEMDCDALGIPAAAATASDAAAHDMSTSIALTRAGFQMVLDHYPIKVPGESWPLDP